MAATKEEDVTAMEEKCSIKIAPKIAVTLSDCSTLRFVFYPERVCSRSASLSNSGTRSQENQDRATAAPEHLEPQASLCCTRPAAGDSTALLVPLSINPTAL